MIQPDEIIRSNRRTLSVCITPLGRVIIRAPKTCDQERIVAFLRDKQRWIAKHKAKIDGAGICLPPDNVDGYAFLFLGKRCVIRLCQRDTVFLDEDTWTLFAPRATTKKRLVAWLKARAKTVLSQATTQQALRMQTRYQSIAVTSAKKRWGSCSANNSVRYSYRLVYAPPDVIRYVVVHELAHTKHKNHSAAFWREVERFEPDWKQKRAWLKAHAYVMEIF